MDFSRIFLGWAEKMRLGFWKGLYLSILPLAPLLQRAFFRSSDPVASSRPLPGLSLPGKDPGPHDTTAQFSRPEAPFH